MGLRFPSGITGLNNAASDALYRTIPARSRLVPMEALRDKKSLSIQILFVAALGPLVYIKAGAPGRDTGAVVFRYVRYAGIGGWDGNGKWGERFRGRIRKRV